MDDLKPIRQNVVVFEMVYVCMRCEGWCFKIRIHGSAVV